MKRFYVLTSFRGWVLSWLTTLNLDRGNDRSFDIYYHSFPMGTCLKHFINTYRCVCRMKSTSIDELDVPYIRPCRIYFIVICIVIENAILVVQRSTGRSSHRRFSIKKFFLQISQNSQQNTWARIYLLRDSITGFLL